MRKNIKNYTTAISVQKTLQDIQSMLARVGARKFMYDYDAIGNLSSVTFGLALEGKGFIPYILPAKVENLAQIVFKKRYNNLTVRQKEQALNTAWRNIYSWVDAQVAMIETSQVKIEQIFLPYMQTGVNETLFDRFESGNLLPKGD